jgi:hypothetical protein
MRGFRGLDLDIRGPSDAVEGRSSVKVAIPDRTLWCRLGVDGEAERLSSSQAESANRRDFRRLFFPLPPTASSIRGSGCELDEGVASALSASVCGLGVRELCRRRRTSPAGVLRLTSRSRRRGRACRFSLLPPLTLFIRCTALSVPPFTFSFESLQEKW